MANDCIVSYLAFGTKQAIKGLKRILECKDDHHYFPRIRDEGSHSITHKQNKLIMLSGYTDVAWSVISSILDEGYTNNLGKLKSNGQTCWNLDEYCFKHNIYFEAYSEEYGVGFQEHITIDPVTEECYCDCEDAYEISIYDKSYEEFLQDVPGSSEYAKYTKEQFQKLQEEKDYIVVGGYDLNDYHWIEDKYEEALNNE